ncbi:YwqG family protein [Aneurinibacillus sp. REN35]|uniref:YwqG family protein n=1 Tax=Aneurinibacillus sp. REN35 TaxID=3237286 RepID=UPI003527E7CF
MQEHLHEKLEKHGMQHIEQHILDNLRPSVALQLEKAEALPIGTSKLGGLPDLPEGWTIPVYNDRPLTFIAQYNLKEMNTAAPSMGLPEQGMLYFFYEAEEQQVWGEADQKEGWRILYYDGHLEALSPAVLPAEDYFMLSSCRVYFHPTKTLDVESLENRINLTEEEEDKYYELLDDLHEFSPSHQAFGHPFAVQNDVFEECGWFSGQENREWVLLLQVDSDEENLNIMWGDVGMIYFCIPKDALAERKFDQAWLIYQCC